MACAPPWLVAQASRAWWRGELAQHCCGVVAASGNGGGCKGNWSARWSRSPRGLRAVSLHAAWAVSPPRCAHTSAPASRCQSLCRSAFQERRGGSDCPDEGEAGVEATLASCRAADQSLSQTASGVHRARCRAAGADLHEPSPPAPAAETICATMKVRTKQQSNGSERLSLQTLTRRGSGKGGCSLRLEWTAAADGLAGLRPGGAVARGSLGRRRRCSGLHSGRLAHCPARNPAAFAHAAHLEKRLAEGADVPPNPPAGGEQPAHPQPPCPAQPRQQPGCGRRSFSPPARC